MASLHSLPVKCRIDFIILLFVFNALYGLAPGYISELLIPCSTSRPLRSADQSLLSIPQTHLKTKGDRAFSVVGPKLWNSLPLTIRSSPFIDGFKIRLKTHLFSLASQLSSWRHAWRHSGLYFFVFHLSPVQCCLCCDFIWFSVLFMSVLLFWSCVFVWLWSSNK